MNELTIVFIKSHDLEIKCFAKEKVMCFEGNLHLAAEVGRYYQNKGGGNAKSGA